MQQPLLHRGITWAAFAFALISSSVQSLFAFFRSLLFCTVEATVAPWPQLLGGKLSASSTSTTSPRSRLASSDPELRQQVQGVRYQIRRLFQNRGQREAAGVMVTTSTLLRYTIKRRHPLLSTV